MQAKINKRTVDAVQPGEHDQFVWDNQVKGFGLKVTPRGKRVYILQYRMHRQLRRYTIGRHGNPWTAEGARAEAIRLLGQITDGTDPGIVRDNAKSALTVSELCDLYLRDGCGGKKASTIATDRGRIERHIKPLMGRKLVAQITPNDVKRLLQDVACGKTAVDIKTGKHGRARVTGGKGTATRTVGLLGGIFRFAVDAGLRSDNPVHGIKRYPDRRNERFLTPAELAVLGDVLRQVEKNGENVVAVNAIRLLLLTGCRKSEVLSLSWKEVDFEAGYLNLTDSKTGQKRVPLGAAALQLLASLPRVEGNPYVFPGEKPGAHLVGLPRAWNRIRARAGLDDVRLHDLRHSFASLGAGAGMGLAIVGKLLGHVDPKTTARYAHIADDPARAAADRIANQVAELMSRGNKPSNVVAISKDKP